jgi:hypothetical protein
VHQIARLRMFVADAGSLGVRADQRDRPARRSTRPTVLAETRKLCAIRAWVKKRRHSSTMPKAVAGAIARGDPSRADELLTQSLKSALALVDVRTLDHLVVGGTSTISFAERGLL